MPRPRNDDQPTAIAFAHPARAGTLARHQVGLILVLAGLMGWVLLPLISATAAPSLPQSSAHRRGEDPSLVDPSTGSGIKELIPEKYRRRYQEWKNEFLSTDTGRKQWEMYEHNPRFLLTITVARENQEAAAAGQYQWDDSGALIAATITLGCRIDEGYPSPVDYYPVTHSLELFESWYVENSGQILAAAKIAHEFGHVNQMADKGGVRYQLQNQLITVYDSIFLVNGYNTRDPRLIELARQMGGAPVEVWEDREYWAEANAMLYLYDKIGQGLLPCSLFTRMKQNVELYAQEHEQRFVLVRESKSTPPPCASQRLPRLAAKH